MKYSLIAVAITAALGAGSALANNDCRGGTFQDGGNCNDTITYGGAGGAGIGTGVANAQAAAAAAAAAKAQQEQFQAAVALAVQKQLQANQQALTFQQYYSANPGRDNTPSIGMGGLYPSANCHGTSNIGGSGPGLSLAFGTSWKDDDCGKRETARLFGVNTPDGIAVLCSSQYAAEAPSCKKAAAEKKAAEALATVAADDPKKKKTSDEQTKKAEVSRARDCVFDEFIARRTGTALCR